MSNIFKKISKFNTLIAVFGIVLCLLAFIFNYINMCRKYVNKFLFMNKFTENF